MTTAGTLDNLQLYIFALGYFEEACDELALNDFGTFFHICEGYFDQSLDGMASMEGTWGAASFSASPG